MSEVRGLCIQLDWRVQPLIKTLTHSVYPRMRRASQMDAAANNDGGAAMRRHSSHWISSRYLPIVLT